MQIGTRPAVSDRAVADAILENADLLGYFTEDQLSDADLGQFLIEPNEGQFKLRLQLETTPELGTTPFAPAGPPVEWNVPSAGEKSFMRVGARKPAN